MYSLMYMHCVTNVDISVCLCLSAVNFQTHLSNEYINMDLPDNHKLWVLIEAKDPDDEVCPGCCRIFFFLSLQFGKSPTLSHHFLHLKADVL